MHAATLPGSDWVRKTNPATSIWTPPFHRRDERRSAVTLLNGEADAMRFV